MKNWEKEFVEKGASMEHNRWAKWQKYLHSKTLLKIKSRFDEPDVRVIPIELYERWERQIATDYTNLSEKEKESDREQVREYIPLISNLLEKQKEEIIEKIEKPLTDSFYYCNLEPEEAREKAENIINKIKEL